MPYERRGTARSSTGRTAGEVVKIELGGDDHNHLTKPEDRLNLAMAFQ